eukprot:COSAG03_NODE_1407_length_4140_cov_3.756001_4_plen_60_part_00
MAALTAGQRFAAVAVAVADIVTGSSMRAWATSRWALIPHHMACLRAACALVQPGRPFSI